MNNHKVLVLGESDSFDMTIVDQLKEVNGVRRIVAGDGVVAIKYVTDKLKISSLNTDPFSKGIDAILAISKNDVISLTPIKSIINLITKVLKTENELPKLKHSSLVDDKVSSGYYYIETMGVFKNSVFDKNFIPLTNLDGLPNEIYGRASITFLFDSGEGQFIDCVLNSIIILNIGKDLPKIELTQSHKVALEKVRSAVWKKVQDGKRELVKQLLSQFKVARVMDLSEERALEFSTELELL